MRIILAGPRGFCAGVNMAIEALELAIGAYGTPLYVYHEIVHNKWVVDWFRRQGVVFVNDLAEVPEGRTPALLGPRRAAGDPPAGGRAASEDHRRHLPAGDQGPPRGHPLRPSRATRSCLIGHAGHDEVVGTMGEAPQAIRLIQTDDGRRSARSARPVEGGLSDADHPVGRRCGRDHRAICGSGSRRSSVRRGTTSAMPRRTGRRRFGVWPPRPTWCWSSAARTVRTASGWPSWPARAAWRPT